MTSKTTWVRVRLPGRVEGEMELAPVTVVMGLPRSGKTALLRALYGSMYYAYVRNTLRPKLQYPPRDLLLLAKSVETREDEWELASFRDCESCEPRLSVVCSRDGCTLNGQWIGVKPLFIPSEVDYVMKHIVCDGSDLYSGVAELVASLLWGIYEKPKCTGGYETVLDRMPEPKLVTRDGQLYEVVGSSAVEISNSSTTTAKLGVLEESLRRGLLDRYTHIFFDNPDAGLHPLSQAKLALMMHALANCGKTVVVATHNVMFVDMLTRTDYVSRMVGASVKPASVAIYAIEDGRIKRYESYASYIRDYTPYIYALYGYSPVEWGKDYMVLRKGGP